MQVGIASVNETGVEYPNFVDVYGGCAQFGSGQFRVLNQIDLNWFPKPKLKANRPSKIIGLNQRGTDPVQFALLGCIDSSLRLCKGSIVSRMPNLRCTVEGDHQRQVGILKKMESMLIMLVMTMGDVGGHAAAFVHGRGSVHGP